MPINFKFNTIIISLLASILLITGFASQSYAFTVERSNLIQHLQTVVENSHYFQNPNQKSELQTPQVAPQKPVEQLVDKPADKGSFVFLLSTFQFIILALLCYYILVARPSQQADDERKKLVEELKKGDEVLISGTIYGKVFSKSDREIIVEVSQGVKFRVVPEKLSRVIAEISA